MSNKREFKKSVESLCAALVDEMSISYYNVENADRDLITSAIAKIVGAMEEARKASNKIFDKGTKDFDSLKAYNQAKKQYIKENYDNAVAKFNEAVSSAMKDYNAAMPKVEKA